MISVPAELAVAEGDQGGVAVNKLIEDFSSVPANRSSKAATGIG